MPVTINGTGSIDGITAGGLPDATVTPADLTQPLTLGTAIASTSGTAIDFTGIPSWAKRITVMLSGVSTNGSSMVIAQLGSGVVETSGYASFGEGMTAAAMTATAYTTGFGLRNSQTAAEAVHGQLMFVLLNANTWVMQGAGAVTGGATGFTCGGGKTLSGTLNRIRVTTINGTDAFDAGSINIMYEG